jgi:hypothetical protein
MFTLNETFTDRQMDFFDRPEPGKITLPEEWGHTRGSIPIAYTYDAALDHVQILTSNPVILRSAELHSVVEVGIRRGRNTVVISGVAELDTDSDSTATALHNYEEKFGIAPEMRPGRVLVTIPVDRVSSTVA